MMRASWPTHPLIAARAALGLLALAAAVPIAIAAPAGDARVAPATAPQGARPPTTGARPLGPAGSPRPGVAPAPGPASRYRIVGCRSHGTSAYRHGPPRREVAIGFDDGPAPDTAAFVAMLERSHVQATFFMIGRQLSSAYA